MLSELMLREMSSNDVIVTAPAGTVRTCGSGETRHARTKTWAHARARVRRVVRARLVMNPR